VAAGLLCGELVAGKVWLVLAGAGELSAVVSGSALLVASSGEEDPDQSTSGCAANLMGRAVWLCLLGGAAEPATVMESVLLAPSVCCCLVDFEVGDCVAALGEAAVVLASADKTLELGAMAVTLPGSALAASEGV
jgi:hypothetical protein